MGVVPGVQEAVDPSTLQYPDKFHAATAFVDKRPEGMLLNLIHTAGLASPDCRIRD